MSSLQAAMVRHMFYFNVDHPYAATFFATALLPQKEHNKLSLGGSTAYNELIVDFIRPFAKSMLNLC